MFIVKVMKITMVYSTTGNSMEEIRSYWELKQGLTKFCDTGQVPLNYLSFIFLVSKMGKTISSLSQKGDIRVIKIK